MAAHSPRWNLDERARRFPLLAAMRERVLVFDGAMGTEIYRHHVFTNRSFDELCLSDSKLIETIHRDYCDAGADVLTTNTFGAQRPDGGAAVSRTSESPSRLS